MPCQPHGEVDHQNDKKIGLAIPGVVKFPTIVDNEVTKEGWTLPIID